MYNQIVAIYDQLFPLNHGFLELIPPYLGEAGSKILDLGCGPGDYVDWFSRRGYVATGIDSSEAMIRNAKEEKQGRFYPYSFLELNKVTEVFDCAYCIGNSLSYLPNDDLVHFLDLLARRVAVGGYFVLQMVNWDRYRATGSYSFPVKVLEDGRTFHRRYEEGGFGHVWFHTALHEGAWSAPL